MTTAPPGLPAPTPARVGQPFPSITLEGPGYSKHRIPEDYRGRTVVLSWFPWAFSPVCTDELTGFARVQREVATLDATIVAASCDHWYSNEAYRISLGAEYPVLSDWNRTESRRLGLFDEAKHRPTRHIQVIDKQGVLRWERAYPTNTCPRVEDFLGELKKLV